MPHSELWIQKGRQVMKIDVVQMYRDASGEYRWRRRDGGNHEITAASTESYTSKGACIANITSTQAEPYMIVDQT